jgi:hypothetical protein
MRPTDPAHVSSLQINIYKDTLVALGSDLGYPGVVETIDTIDTDVEGKVVLAVRQVSTPEWTYAKGLL